MLDTLTYLSSLYIFTKNDVVQYVGNERNATALLYNYSKKGVIANVRRNLYCICNLATRQPEATKMQIASAVTPTACVSYHSAMEYYGFANQVFYEMQVASETKFNNFDFDGISYTYQKQNQTVGIVSPPADTRIRVTDIERTIIDCANHIDLCGGIEELLQCLRLITYVDENKLTVYLKAFNNKSLCKKVGFIMELFATQLHISQEFLRFCQDGSKGTVAYLTDNRGNCQYNKKWNLYIPKNIVTFNEIESYDAI